MSAEVRRLETGYQGAKDDEGRQAAETLKQARSQAVAVHACMTDLVGAVYNLNCLMSTLLGVPIGDVGKACKAIREGRTP